MTRFGFAVLYRQNRRTRTHPDPYTRVDLFSRWGGTCAYCAAPAEHVDHVTPICNGGKDVLRNVLPSCADCNLAKGGKSLAEWAASF